MAATNGNSSTDMVVVVDENSTKMVTLISSDGEHFDVTEAAAGMSQIITYMIEDGCVEHGVTLPNVDSKTLAKVVEYRDKHAAVVETDGVAAINHAAELRSFDKNFITVDNNTLFHIILAANFLEIKGLLGLACQAVADQLKQKSVEEIRKTFNVVNDFTPEEEEAIRKENAWAFD